MRIAAFLPALALALALPVVAHAADQSGTAGVANRIDVNSPSSDAYLQYHGRLFVISGTTSTEYRWGGTSCGSRTMTPEMIALLVDTVRQGDLKIQPTYQAGQGTTKCLVGFSVQAKQTTSKKGR
ncbi:MAG: hypothetical protein R6X02_22865 [Enhygromyxa sp.]